MVNVGIVDADLPLAGEILRILINHPETEIHTLFAPAFTGRNISSLHHGFIGEQPLNFTDKLSLQDLDYLILLRNNELNKNIIDHAKDYDNLKIVVYDKNLVSENLSDFEVGLSEINRKALVRGAKKAYIPASVIVPALITLAPLASFLLLNSDIDIQVSVPEEIAVKFNEKEEAENIETELKKIQSSFNHKVTLTILGNHISNRGAKTTITLKNTLPLSDIENIYDQIYDDHNFTFITRNEINENEVEGTQKVIISLKNIKEDSLVIETFSDAILRGGAGDIVHVLNLFYGLHEKTGLILKPSGF